MIFPKMYEEVIRYKFKVFVVTFKTTKFNPIEKYNHDITNTIV